MPDDPPADGLTHLTDEQLVVAYRDGTVPALRVLLERYEQELFHFLIRFAGNRASAEDLFQEAFLQVHISAGTFDATKRFKPWLFTIAANKARDHLRKQKRRRAAPLSALIDSSGESGASFIDLLEADWSLLNQPSRLQRLSKAFETELGLKSIEPEQMAQPDELPGRASDFEPQMAEGGLDAELTTGSVQQ